MDIVIPKELWGETGRAIQEVGRALGNFSDSVAGVAQRVADQQAKMETRQLYNDMELEINQYTKAELDRTDGTDSKTLDNVKKGIDEIKNKYMQKASSSRVQAMLDEAHMVSNLPRLQQADKIIQDKLWATTIEGVKIYVGEQVNKTVTTTGDLTEGWKATEGYIDSMGEYLGPRAKDIKNYAMSLYTSSAIIGTLSNPQTAPAMINAFDEDVKYKERAYSYLTVEDIPRVQSHLERATKNLGERKAFWDIGAKFGTNYAGAYKYTLSPAAGKKYGLDVNQQQNIAQSFAALANTQKETAKYRDEEVGKFLLSAALTGNISTGNIENSALSREKKDIFLGILKTPISENGFKTNPVTEAKLGDRIFSDPENVSDLEIALHVGRGLSRTDAEKLIKQRDYFIRDKIPEHQKTQAKVIYDALEDDYKAGVFGDKEKRSSSIEYARKKSQFQRWLIQNPDKEPAQWYEEIIGQEQKNFIGRFLDWAAERNATATGKGQKKEAPKKKYKAKMADGTMIYSDDGNNWYDDKGVKVE